MTNDSGLEPTSQTQRAVSAGSPGPAPVSPRAGQARSGGPARTVYLVEPVRVRDLADALGRKPFAIVADLLALKRFKSADEEIDFATAALIARKYGCRAERPPPGMLVL